MILCFFWSCVPYSYYTSDSWGIPFKLNQPHFSTLDAGAQGTWYPSAVHWRPVPWRSSRSRRCWPWHSWSLPHCERHEDHWIPVPNWLVYPMRNGDFIGLQWWFFMGFYMSIHIRITICKNPLNWDLNSHQGYEPVKIRGMIKKSARFLGQKADKDSWDIGYLYVFVDTHRHTRYVCCMLM